MHENIIPKMRNRLCRNHFPTHYLSTSFVLGYDISFSSAMKISFHGAARTVTGSKHIIHLSDGRQILLDCGLFQGLGKETDDFNERFGFNPAKIDAVILSHAHIDHSGLLPKLVKEGYNGQIISTAATKDLSEILLYDSAEIQTYEVEYINKRRAAKNLLPYEPLGFFKLMNMMSGFL
jgi:metallo-beta-lactamase family protein